MAEVFMLSSAAVLLLANIFHIAGFSSNFWSVFKGEISVHLGLWKMCVNVYCVKMSGSSVEAWMKAVQAMECLGLIFLLGTIVFTAIILPKKFRMKWHIMSGLTAYVSCIFIVIGVIIFGIKIKEADTLRFGYSFYLCICAAILGLFAAAIPTIGAFIRQTEKRPHCQGVVYPTQPPALQSSAVNATLPSVPLPPVIPSAPDASQQTKSCIDSPPPYSKVVDTSDFTEPNSIVNTSNDIISPPPYAAYQQYEQTVKP